MTPAEGLAHLEALPASSIKMGLARVRAALDKLGRPERQVPAVHVAGTNGKGSTCAFLASCLQQRYLTGLYTSPHLHSVTERIKVDGVDISDAELGLRVAEVVAALGDGHELTFFELGTVVAFWHFAVVGVDIAVLETGLGGRLDATTACVPLVTCITPISFDHMEYLGTTLVQIATEKAGIIKVGVPLVCAQQDAEVLVLIDRLAFEQKAPLLLEGREWVSDGTSFQSPLLKVHGLEVPLHGAHQVQNMSLALACLSVLDGLDFSLSTEQVRKGVHDTRWPGRLEEFGGAPPVVFDGAHNPGGVAVLLKALDDVYPGRPVHLVFGVFSDKDSEPMIRALFPRCAAVYLAPLDSPRGRDPATYLELANTLNAHVTVHASAPGALAAARAACPEGGLVLVAGSLRLVGQLRGLLTD
jgi:dihydrofolate synthase/folylpolyglutamate synthase